MKTSQFGFVAFESPLCVDRAVMESEILLEEPPGRCQRYLLHVEHRKDFRSIERITLKYPLSRQHNELTKECESAEVNKSV